MTYSDLQPGDIITEFTNFGGRTYTYEVTRVGFTHSFGDELFTSGVYQAKGYEFICNGRIGISEIKKGYTIDPELCRVERNGIVIN